MESKNIQESEETPHVTFSHLEDAKDYMMFVVDQVEMKRRAAQRLVNIGIPENDPSMNEARRDTRHAAQLLLSVYQEFRRLHPGNCDCSVTDEQIVEGMRGVQELIDDIDKSQTHADSLPPLTNSQKMNNMITGIRRVLDERADIFNAFDRDRSGVRDASDGGTGMYL
jgi:hypothetical protein